MNDISLKLIELALFEDLEEAGDLTSHYFVDQAHRSVGRIVSREDAIVSGVDVAEEVCRRVDPELTVTTMKGDGESVCRGELVLEIAGATQSILTAERTALNFMQRLSGVATVTRTYSERISHTSAQLLDTRKTTPGFRELEKAAVLHGGGTNHRIGLFDAVMVKDNHLAANLTPVDLATRIAEVKSQRPALKIEVEADRLDQVADFLLIGGIDVVLLDNMTNEQLVEAVAMRDAQSSPILLEASGGVNLETIAGIAETGVDYISVGALTHSVRSIDLGLDLVGAE
ncbi:MAG: carboxylating nicotinate-nucleotide diphosphorylase [Verrucomicrobiales bacterium]|nr:carboxylating nicotinate-nucleotide diphosphorylase [Verrucomicrobiales bacterium]